MNENNTSQKMLAVMLTVVLLTVAMATLILPALEATTTGFTSVWLVLILIIGSIMLLFFLFWIRTGLFVTVTKSDKTASGASLTYVIDNDGKRKERIVKAGLRGKRRIKAKKGSVTTITMVAKNGSIAVGLPAVVVMEHRREYLEIALKHRS
jgi:hypothetical protein